MDQSQLKLWAGLYDRLEPSEASELYFAHKKISVPKDQVVFKQGDFDSNLYFIQDGSLEMNCYVPAQKENFYLGELIAGDIANMESFFSHTVCIYTLKARRNGQISFLPKDILTAWKENYAGLEPKLHSYCREKDVFRKKMAELELNKRSFERFQTSAMAKVQLLDNEGGPVNKPFKIALFDISRGGVGFGMKVNNPQEAEMLLQHRLFLQAVYRDGDEKKKIGFKGQVVAVHLQPFGESSIHVQFDQIQDMDTIQNLVG
jgi:CRP-like cAMP-binding protein